MTDITSAQKVKLHDPFAQWNSLTQVFNGIHNLKCFRKALQILRKATF